MNEIIYDNELYDSRNKKWIREPDIKKNRNELKKRVLKTKGIKTRVFEKGRKKKKLLIQCEIPFEKLTHTTIRYLDCLRNDFPLI